MEEAFICQEKYSNCFEFALFDNIYCEMDLVYYPDDALKKACEPVVEFSNSLKKIFEDMKRVMNYSNGVGLAAPQVGLNVQLLIVDPSGGQDESALTIMVNPKVLWVSEEEVDMSEGCLSIPNVFLNVTRPEWVEVEYSSLEGDLKIEKMSEWKARIFLHEYDHLHGKLMFDRVDSKTKKMMMQFYVPPHKNKNSKPKIPPVY